MGKIIQGRVADALDSGELYNTAGGRKEGYMVDKQYISTYVDVLVGFDNFSGGCYIFSYHWIRIGPYGIALQCGDGSSVYFLSSGGVF